MKTLKKPTIHDVAHLAGVSIKTASRVLNKDPQVRKANVAKVEEAIKQLNYKLDINAKRLRSKKSYLISILYSDYRGNFYSNMVIAGALNVCDKMGYDMVIRPFDANDIYDVNDAKIIPVVDYMLGRSNPDGIIIVPPLSHNEALTSYLQEQGVPFVRISPCNHEMQNFVHCDEVSASKNAIEYLISLGHTDIGFINYLYSYAAGKWRFDGYKSALIEANISLKPEFIEQDISSLSAVEHAARRMLTLPTPPSAIFTTNDAAAAILYRVATQLNIKIPYELSIIGFDDDPISENLWPPLTTMKQPIFELGTEAARLLINKFIKKNELVDIKEHKCKLLVRSSCGPKG